MKNPQARPWRFPKLRRLKVGRLQIYFGMCWK